mmetsp:Transcript_78487/g.199652  ORF Transcript_78487/g.199652 Transcript_78487/m.199652 type:complete len:235 (+) Transcript_78487:470-1174(+)
MPVRLRGGSPLHPAARAEAVAACARSRRPCPSVAAASAARPRSPRPPPPSSKASQRPSRCRETPARQRQGASAEAADLETASPTWRHGCRDCQAAASPPLRAAASAAAAAWTAPRCTRRRGRPCEGSPSTGALEHLRCRPSRPPRVRSPSPPLQRVGIHFSTLVAHQQPRRNGDARRRPRCGVCSARSASSAASGRGASGGGRGGAAARSREGPCSTTASARPPPPPARRRRRR